MRFTRSFITVAGFAILALASFVSAGGAAERSARAASARQNLTITASGRTSGLGGPTTGTFELLGASGAETDIGKLTYKAPLIPAGRKTPDGLSFTLEPFTATFTGRHGALVIRASVRHFDVVHLDDSIATGTWSVVSGTGRYAGLKGGGALVGLRRGAGSGSISDYVSSYRFQGHVSKG